MNIPIYLFCTWKRGEAPNNTKKASEKEKLKTYRDGNKLLLVNIVKETKGEIEKKKIIFSLYKENLNLYTCLTELQQAMKQFEFKPSENI